MEQKLNLEIIVFSVRPTRVGDKVGKWIYDFAVQNFDFTTDLVDLKEVNLPIFDEPEYPRLGKYVHEHTKKWSEIVKKADCYVFVVPEYNFGMTGATKNALDYLSKEWAYKPVAFVSYGGISGGTRAVQMIKQVVTTLKMVPLFEAVHIPSVHGLIQNSKFVPTNEIESGAKLMLDELKRWAIALRPLREEQN